MAGLSLTVGAVETTPTRLLNQAAGSSVTVSLTTGAWEDYSLQDPADGWYIFGPEEDESLALSGDASAIEDKTFTPKYPGDYIVFLLAYKDGEPVRLSAVYNVFSPYGAGTGVPAPQEQDERESAIGWSRALQRIFTDQHRLLGGRNLIVVSNDGTPADQFSLLKLSGGYKAMSNAGVSGDDTRLFLHCVVANAVNVSGETVADDDIVVMALEPIFDGEVGLCIISGPLPFETAELNVNDTLYLSDAGFLSNGPGTVSRALATVTAQGSVQFSDSPSIGAISFNGYPSVAAEASAQLPDSFIVSNDDWTGWVSTSTLGGATDCKISTLRNGGIVMTTKLASDDSPVSGLRKQGAVKAVSSGDFTLAYRVYLNCPDIYPNVNVDDAVDLCVAFIDGSNVDTSPWYGVSFEWVYAQSVDDEPNVYEMFNISGGALWDSDPIYIERKLNAYRGFGMYDVWLARTGTTLNMFYARAGGTPHLVGSHAVSSGAGYAGLRFQLWGANEDRNYYIGCVLHERLSSYSLPWLP